MPSIQRKREFNEMTAGAILVVIAVLYSIMTYATPLGIDDYMFMSIWNDHSSDGSFSIGNLADYYNYIRSTDNGRIANLVAPFTSVFSPFKDIYPVMNGIMIALLVWLTYAAGVRWKKGNDILFLTLTWAAIIVFLPWYNSILFANYALNYTWSAVSTLALIIWFVRSEKEGWRAGRLIAGIVLAVIAGGWHESFALPTICGLFLYILTKAGRVSLRFYIVTFIYLGSALLFMLSPGLIARFGFSVSDQHQLPSVRYYIVLIILLLVLVGFILTKRGRTVIAESVKSPIALIFTGIMISGYFIGLVTVNNPRSYYWANLATIIMILYLFRRIDLFSQWKRLNIILSAFLFLCCVAQTIIVICWEKKYNHENEEIISRLEKSENGLVYYDYNMPRLTPRYTLNMPTSEFWGHPWQFRVLSWYYKKPMLSVVPTGIQTTRYEDGESMKGNPVIKNVRGRLVSPYELLDPYENLIIPGFKDIKLKLKDNSTIEKKILASPFISEEYVHRNGEVKSDTLLYLDIQEIEPSEIESIISVANTPIEGFPLMYQKGRKVNMDK